MNRVCAGGMCVAVLAAGASAQQPVQLQLRFVPQTGGFGAANPLAQNFPVNGPVGPLGANTAQRFRLDYRVIDLIPGDSVYPAGLWSGLLNITATNTPGVGPTVSVSRGLLSTREASQQRVPPAGAPNAGNTGNAGNDATDMNPSGRTGLCSPFRGAMADQNSNSDTNNGTIVGLSINGIRPLSLSWSAQGLAGYDDGSGNPAFPLTGNEWYALYVFTLSTGSSPGNGGITFTAAFAPDATTGNSFGYFIDGTSLPQASPNSLSASIAITVVPAPGLLGWMVLGGVLAIRRRSR